MIVVPGDCPADRKISWLGITALAFGGANQSIYLIDGLIGGQSGIAGQGGAALPLLAVGFLIVCVAAPGWLELVLMSPGRVGGIGAACGAAFRSYSPILAAIAGVSVWWGWAATTGLAATIIAGIIGPLLLPGVPVWALGSLLVLIVALATLTGLRSLAVIALAVAAPVTLLASISGLLPLWQGTRSAGAVADLALATPFVGSFGHVTAAMAGLFLVGYGAPCVEAALAFVGCAHHPLRDTKRALLATLAIGAAFFIVLPAIWYWSRGTAALSDSLDQALGPTFAPLLGRQGAHAAIAFVTLCWLQTMIYGLGGAPLTLAQLAQDGMAPSFLGALDAQSTPRAAVALTAMVAIALVFLNDTTWVQGSANFAYVIGIFLPSLAVWLLRRDQPETLRPYRAPRWLIHAGLAGALLWPLSLVIGAEQFGLPALLLGLTLGYSGVALFALRKWQDRRTARSTQAGPDTRSGRTLYVDLTLSLVVAMTLNAIGYILALARMGHDQQTQSAILTDLFIAVSLLSLGIGVVLPGRIAHTAEQLSDAARYLTQGTLRDLSDALTSLGRGDLAAAQLRADFTPLPPASSSELGDVIVNFNTMQAKIRSAATGLENSRLGLAHARERLEQSNTELRAQVAEQERMAAELASARDAAQAGERSKSEFLALMSHELRTPLNGVIGLSGLLMDGSLDAQSRLYARMLRDAGEHLLDMINDLLDLTRMEAGKVEFERVEFDIDTLVQGVLDLVVARAHAKSLDFGIFIATEVPRTLIGDPARLRQILINLVGNAVKFTESGAVVLNVDLRDATLAADGSTAIRLQFSVSDTGIGIDAQDMPDLFQRFSQVDQSISRRFGGSGLGLSICHRLVSGMGGTIAVDSTPGLGSIFRFQVPFQTARYTHSAAIRDRARLNGERVLIVHRPGVGARLLEAQVVSRGGIALIATSEAEAMERLVQAARSAHPLQAVVIQHELFNGGAELFAAAVRRTEALRGIRLILVSQSDFAPDGAKEAAGLFDARLLRPVPVDTLIYRLSANEPAVMAAGTDHAKTTTTKERKRRLRILAAEDNKTNQAVIKAMLTKLSHSVDIADNGRIAVEAVRTTPYDLVLMDVMMPELDGIQATRQIRALPGRSGQVHVIALTADASAGHPAACADAGMQSVLNKPLTLRALHNALERAEKEIFGH